MQHSKNTPRLRWLLTGLLALALGGCGAAQAVGDYAAADAEWNDFNNKKTQKVRAAYESGVKMHEEYMAMQPPADADARVSVAWYERQSMLLGKLDEHFTPVFHSSFHEKSMFVTLKQAEGWEKLLVELQTQYAAGGDAHPQKATLVANQTQAALNAATYYKRIGADYPMYDDTLPKRHPSVFAAAAKKAAALKAVHADLEAQRQAL